MTKYAVLDDSSHAYGTPGDLKQATDIATELATDAPNRRFYIFKMVGVVRAEVLTPVVTIEDEE